MEIRTVCDVDLMVRIAAGDRAAFSTLIERHQLYVHKLAYRFVGHWDVADDLTQDAFLNVYRAAATYRPTAAFSTWLYRLVLNLARDWRKVSSRRSRHLPLPRPPDGCGPSSQTERSEVVDLVKAAVQALPENQRDALILHRYCDLSHREIAEIMGKSESAIESYLVRAYVNLRGLIQGRRQDEAGPQGTGMDVVEWLEKQE
jgi:RNA polymerase sigma-70 factor, ECF subfamily